MFDSFLSQLLVLLMLFAGCMRIFFTKSSKIDSGAILSPAAFLISLLNIYIWNASFQNILLLILSFIIMLTNMRAFIRLSQKLYVDRYSLLFISSTFIELAAVIVCTVLIVKDRPVKIDLNQYSVIKKTARLNGNMSRGFDVIQDNDYLRTSNGTLYTWTNENYADSPAVILIAGSSTAEITDYEPYILFLASKGWTVLGADFYSDDAQYLPEWKNRRFFRKYLSTSASGSEKTEADTQSFKLNQVNSYKALTKLAEKLYEGKGLFFIADSLDFDSITEICENAGQNLTGFYPLNKIAEYKTPGLGFIEQTNVHLAKKYGLSRDKSLFIPRYAAGKTLAELTLITGMPELKPLETEETAETKTSSEERESALSEESPAESEGSGTDGEEGSTISSSN